MYTQQVFKSSMNGFDRVQVLNYIYEQDFIAEQHKIELENEIQMLTQQLNAKTSQLKQLENEARAIEEHQDSIALLNDALFQAEQNYKILQNENELLQIRLASHFEDEKANKKSSEEEMAKTEEDVSELENEIEELRKKNEELEYSLLNAKSDEQTQALIAKQQNDIHRLREKNKRITELVEGIRNKFDEIQSANEHLKLQLADTQNINVRHMEQLRLQSTEVLEKDRALRDVLLQIDKHKKTIENQDGHISRLKENHTEQLEQLKNSHREQLVQKDTIIGQLRQYEELYKTSLEENQANIKNSEKILAEHRNQMLELQQININIQNQLYQKDAQIEDFKRINETQNKELEQVKSSHTAELTEKDSIIDKLKQFEELYNSSVEENKAQVKNSEKILAEQKAQMLELQQLNDNIQNQLSQKDAQIEDFKRINETQNKELEQVKSSHTAEILEKDSEIKQLRQFEELYKSSLENNEDQAQKAEKMFAEQRTQMLELQQANADMQTQISKKDSELEDFKRIRENHSKELEQIKSSHSAEILQKDSEIKQLRQFEELYKSSLEDNEDQAQKTEKMFEEHKAQILELQKLNASIQSQLTQKDSQIASFKRLYEEEKAKVKAVASTPISTIPVVQPQISYLSNTSGITSGSDITEHSLKSTAVANAKSNVMQTVPDVHHINPSISLNNSLVNNTKSAIGTPLINTGTKYAADINDVNLINSVTSNILHNATSPITEIPIGLPNVAFEENTVIEKQIPVIPEIPVAEEFFNDTDYPSFSAADGDLSDNKLQELVSQLQNADWENDELNMQRERRAQAKIKTFSEGENGFDGIVGNARGNSSSSQLLSGNIKMIIPDDDISNIDTDGDDEILTKSRRLSDIRPKRSQSGLFQVTNKPSMSELRKKD